MTKSIHRDFFSKEMKLATCLLFIAAYYAEATCTRGPPGLLPGTTLVDGTTYPRTRPGVQAAIDAVGATAFGGVVFVTGDVTSDGSSLQIKSNVMLDFGGHTYKAPATSTSLDVIALIGTEAVPAPLVTDGLRGTSFVNVSLADAATFTVGDLVVITKGQSPCGLTALTDGNMTNEIVGIDLVIGSLALRAALGHNYNLNVNPAVVRQTPVTDAGLRNIIVDANDNTGTGTRMVHAYSCQRCNFRNVKLIGTHSPNNLLLSNSVSGFMARTGMDNTFAEIISESYSGGTECRDISFSQQTSAFISDIRSYGTGGFGPNLARSHHCVWNGLIVQNTLVGRGFRIDTSSDNTFYGLMSSNHYTDRGSGLFLAFGSHHNTLNGVTLSGAGAGGYCISDSSDCYNIVYGLQVTGCQSYQVLLGTGTSGNVVYGNIGGNNDTLRVQDLGVGNIICSLNSGPGTMACTQSTGIPDAGSFPALKMLSTSRIDDTHVAVNMRGSDGTVRYASIPISTTGAVLPDLTVATTFSALVTSGVGFKPPSTGGGADATSLDFVAYNKSTINVVGACPTTPILFKFSRVGKQVSISIGDMPLQTLTSTDNMRTQGTIPPWACPTDYDTFQAYRAITINAGAHIPLRVGTNCTITWFGSSNEGPFTSGTTFVGWKAFSIAYPV